MMSPSRLEVMRTIERSMDEILSTYLRPIEENWQPSDFLPDARSAGFHAEIRELQECAKGIGYDLWAVLIGDTITEEALPTYTSWLMCVEGVDQTIANGWSKWVRGWSSEENRHGDLLHKYLFLSGRVDMKQMDITTQHLINDGFDIGSGTDPYRNFFYTSFQELATNISHRRVASLAQKGGDRRLAKICGLIAADERRHANAYMNFVKRIIELDPSEYMLAFEEGMRRKVAMPAHFMRESGGRIGSAFAPFADAAQRLGVYTTQDYIDVLRDLLREWGIETLGGLNAAAEKARDYLMALPDRLERISSRIRVPEKSYGFKWIAGAGGA